MSKIRKVITKPSFKIAMCYSVIVIFCVCLFSLIIPKVLNYGPESINTQFDIDMSYIPYWSQILCVIILIIILLTIITKKLLKEIDEFDRICRNKKKPSKELIRKVRRKCFAMPYVIPTIEVIAPITCACIILFATGSHQIIMIGKILTMVFCISLLLAFLSYVFSKEIYNQILRKTYKENAEMGLRLGLKLKNTIQVSLPIIFSILFLYFIGYSTIIREKESDYFNIYDKKLTSAFSQDEEYTFTEVINKMKKMELLTEDTSKFVIDSKGNVLTLAGEEPSEFVIKYTKEIAQKYKGRTYDSYGVDTQGKTMKIKTDNGECYIGIMYSVLATDAAIYLGVSSILLLAISAVMLYIFNDSLSGDIKEISDNFEKLTNQEFGKILPIISNDEIGDLVKSFNEVQRNSKHQVELIKDNQEVLMEQERLATLGQMVGGIAHNLKTPIMSISGAGEGLKDLIKEYDESIEDQEVTPQDHHDIAKEMNEWVDKIQDYTEYMSDIITTVKGQAVTMSNREIVSFTVEELVKRVNILMRYELKHSLTELNVTMEVADSLCLKGDINSLIQVLNNLISNAIQAYGENDTKTIDLKFEYKGKNQDKLLISVRDYGKGIPKEVQNKLFKEMVTTKGKNGTGLGLFMSYSNIRAHFNGNMGFESVEGKGTVFYIELPIAKK